MQATNKRFGVAGAAAIAATVFLALTGGAAAPAAAPVAKVPVIDAAGLKKQVAARKGKVVVVNFWATWCVPCVEEFPDLVALQSRNKAKGMDLITVSFDETRDVRAKVAPFLTKNRLTTGTYINKSGSDLDEGYLKYLEPKLPDDEAVAIPRTYIFDRRGKLVKVIIGASTLANFQKIVTPLLAKK